MRSSEILGSFYKKNWSSGCRSEGSSSSPSDDDSPGFARRRRWASITERRVADEEADIIISLGVTDPLLAPCATTSLIQRLSQSDYDVGRSHGRQQVATISGGDGDAYCRLQSLGITVARGSSADIL